MLIRKYFTERIDVFYIIGFQDGKGNENFSNSNTLIFVSLTPPA